MPKKMQKSTRNIIAAVLVTAILVGAGIGLWQNWAGYQAGFSVGSAGVAPAVAKEDAASVSANLNTTTFDFTSAVASDGSVTTATSVTKTLYINNTDDELVAQTLYVRLVNPRTDNEGFHDNLETDDTKFGITEGGTTLYIFKEGDYVEDGYFYGNLAAEGELQLTVTMTLDSAVAGTFQDGQTYTCNFWVYQKKADYPTAVPFTVTT